MPVCAATASAWRACAPCRSLWERRTSSPVDTTVASTSSPTATFSLPSASVSSARSIHASPLLPTSTNTLSAVIWMTRPFTIWPTSSTGRAASRANSVAKSSASLMLSPWAGRLCASRSTPRVIEQDTAYLLDGLGPVLERVTRVDDQLRLHALDMRAGVVDDAVAALLDWTRSPDGDDRV